MARDRIEPRFPDGRVLLKAEFSYRTSFPVFGKMALVASHLHLKEW